MGELARHLKLEHGQGVPSRLLGPPSTVSSPMQPRVPIHLMAPHRSAPQRAVLTSPHSREPSPSASLGRLASFVRAAPAHVVPRYDVHGFALHEPTATDAQRQIRALERGPDAPGHWSGSPGLLPIHLST